MGYLTKARHSERADESFYGTNLSAQDDVTTSMREEEVRSFAKMMDNLSKNFIDVEEYPAMGEIESRCVNIIARLFHAPVENSESQALGVSTIGSSEAIILSVLAAKRRWQNLRKAAGKPWDKPNIVMNAAVQVCWEKAARYLEVEEKYWYCKDNKFSADPQELVDLVDENTILVCAILGTTYTGEYEDIKEIDRLLGEKNEKEGLSVYIHVDGASGGFVAPFANPDLVWDFQLPHVCSINASGHKYGLTYAGVGWAVWRNKSFLPDEILFTVNYLGSPQVSFTLNFSKSGVHVIGQYYQFLRLGKSGYRNIMNNLTSTSDWLADRIANIQDAKGQTKFEILGDNLGGKGLPLVAWKLKNQEEYDEFAIARTLRSRGWIVPAYTMAPNASSLKLLRVVVREDFSKARATTFVRDLCDAVTLLDKAPAVVHEYAQKEHEEKQHIKAKRSGKQTHNDDSHSLQGKHGKTHGVC
ncbi:hypothetical protein HWV62_10591 [Athelia sp. TMB]|nr:hypothetical protein HWV62_10591 [Athelia sp. TMB]